MTEFFSTLSGMFAFDFMERAFVMGTLVSVCAALLGVPLVLKRCSMIGDGLSHVAFGTLALAMALNMLPLAVTAPVVMIAAFFLLKVADSDLKSGDAAIAMVSATALAVGISAVSMSEGFNTDAQNYLFGTILAMDPASYNAGLVITSAVLVVYAVLYPRLLAVTFDSSFAKTLGLPVEGLRSTLSVMTAGVIVTGMHLMGALLISSLLVFPAMSAMRLTRSYLKVVVAAALIGAASLWAGLIVSYVWAVPAGAAIVLANAAAFAIAFLVSLARW